MTSYRDRASISTHDVAQESDLDEAATLVAHVEFAPQTDDEVPLATNEVPLARTKLKPTSALGYTQRGAHLPNWYEFSVASERLWGKKSMVSVATESEARSRKLKHSRIALERRARNAVKRQIDSSQTKERHEARRRYNVHEHGLKDLESAMLHEAEEEAGQRDLLLPPGHPRRDAEIQRRLQGNLSARSTLSAASSASSRLRPTYTPQSVWASFTPRSTDSGYICSSYRSDVHSTRDTDAESLAVEEATERVREANEGLTAVHQRQAHRDSMARNMDYNEAQSTYRRLERERKEEAKQQREEHAEVVKEEAEQRREQDLEAARERRRNTKQRLKRQAQQTKDEIEHELKEKAFQQEAQARSVEQRSRKESEKEAKAREIQREITLQKETKAQLAKEFEEAQARRQAEWEKEAKRAKVEANAARAKELATQVAAKAALEKAKFKAAEEERIRREAEKQAQEKEEGRKLRESHRQKMEEIHRKKREEMRDKAKELKKALKDAAAMQYEADARGKMRKKADPSKELERKVKAIKDEQIRVLNESADRERAREVAFEKADKRLAEERLKAVQAAQREIDITFKKNQEKQQADRLAREAAEKERNAKIAKETREKIEAENRRKLEVERQAALHLKEMKVAEYEAAMAKHKRIQRMQDLEAMNQRILQEAVRDEVRDFEQQQAETERETKENALRTYSETRAMKAANEEELHQMKSYMEQKLRLDAEAKRAERAAKEAMEAKEALLHEKQELRHVTDEVRKLKEDRTRSKLGTPRSSQRTLTPGGMSNPFESGFQLFGKLAFAEWGGGGKQAKEKRASVVEAPCSIRQHV